MKCLFKVLVVVALFVVIAGPFLVLHFRADDVRDWIRNGHDLFAPVFTLVENAMVLFPCFLILLYLAAISFSFHHSVRAMLSDPDAQENPDAAPSLLARVPHDFQVLLDAEGFRFTRAYSFHTTTFGVWIRASADPPLRYFVVLKSVGSIHYEFLTFFSDDASLSTTTTRSAFVFPQIFGSFTQSFPRATPDRLWQAHRKGEDHITSAVGVTVLECRLPLVDVLKLGAIRQLSYVTSLRLWFVRGIYWYLIKRFLMHNRPIWRQNIPGLYARDLEITTSHWDHPKQADPLR